MTGRLGVIGQDGATGRLNTQNQATPSAGRIGTLRIDQKLLDDEKKRKDQEVAAKQQADQKKLDDAKNKDVVGNIFKGLSQISKPISEGGANVFADIGKGISDSAKTLFKQGAIGAANNTGVSQVAVDNQAKFLESQVKAGKISQDEANRRKAANQNLANQNKTAVQTEEKKQGVKQDQSAGVMALLDTASNIAGLAPIGKAVFTKAAEAAAKRLGRNLTEDEAKSLAQKTKDLVPEKAPEAPIKTGIATPKAEPIDEMTNPTVRMTDVSAVPTPTVKTPPIAAPELESSLFNAAKTQAEQRLGRPLKPEEVDNLTKQTKSVVTEKMGSQTVSTIQGNPAPSTPKPLKLEGDTVSGNATRIEQKALEKKLTDKMGDLPQYKSINMKDQAKQAIDLVKNDRQKAVDIINGKANPPDGLHPQFVHQALEEVATKEGNGELLTQLAKSHINTELSEGAQRLRIAAERDPTSAVENIRQVQEVRQKALEGKSGRTIKKTAKDIGAKVDAATPKVKKETWASFVESLKC